MLTVMTEDDWAVVMDVFDASQTRSGEPGHNDRKFLEAMQYFTVHNITWRALPAEFGNWNTVWKRFWRLSQSGVFDVFFEALARLSPTAHLVQRCSIAPWHVRMSRQLAQKGAAKSGARALAGWLLEQDPPQDRPRRAADRLSPDRRRGQRQHAVQNIAEYGPDITPRAAMTDKGYDSSANRTACRERGIVPIIPYRDNAKNRPSYFPKVLYRGRARIEQTMGKLKRFKRVALPLVQFRPRSTRWTLRLLVTGGGALGE